jgi:alkaline phosphatase
MGAIEADVYWVNNNLFVAHDAKDINPSKSLDKLYLKPLSKWVRKKKVYPLVLMIDIKSQADSTLEGIVKHISKYSLFLKEKSPIQFIISGNRPPPEKWSSYPHFIQFDGRPSENYTSEQWAYIGMVSESFGKYAKLGQKDIPQETYDKMKMVVDAVHAQKKKIRFWATPDTEGVWKLLMEMKVDFINTDSPTDLRTFLESMQ